MILLSFEALMLYMIMSFVTIIDYNYVRYKAQNQTNKEYGFKAHFINLHCRT